MLCGLPEGMKKILDVAEEVNVVNNKPAKLIMGRHLIELDMSPGKKMGEIIAAAFEAQLNGEFTTVEGGISWVNSKIFESEDSHE